MTKTEFIESMIRDCNSDIACFESLIQKQAYANEIGIKIGEHDHTDSWVAKLKESNEKKAILELKLKEQQQLETTKD